MPTSYGRSWASAVRSVSDSACACATSNRSNGSRCCGGSSVTRVACACVTASGSIRVACILVGTNSTGGAGNVLFPKAYLVEISHAEAADRNSSCSSEAISARAARESRSGSATIHNQHCVSTRILNALARTRGASILLPTSTPRCLPTCSPTSLQKTGLALAPGVAFGAAGEGRVRLCFAASEATLTDALARLQTYWERRVPG